MIAIPREGLKRVNSRASAAPEGGLNDCYPA